MKNNDAEKTINVFIAGLKGGANEMAGALLFYVKRKKIIHPKIIIQVYAGSPSQKKRIASDRLSKNIPNDYQPRFLNNYTKNKPSAAALVTAIIDDFNEARANGYSTQLIFEKYLASKVELQLEILKTVTAKNIDLKNLELFRNKLEQTLLHRIELKHSSDLLRIRAKLNSLCLTDITEFDAYIANIACDDNGKTYGVNDIKNALSWTNPDTVAALHDLTKGKDREGNPYAYKGFISNIEWNKDNSHQYLVTIQTESSLIKIAADILIPLIGQDHNPLGDELMLSLMAIPNVNIMPDGSSVNFDYKTRAANYENNLFFGFNGINPARNMPQAVRTVKDSQIAARYTLDKIIMLRQLIAAEPLASHNS